MQVNFLLFPNLTQLDLTGPYEVLARVPGLKTSLVAKSMEPVRSDRGLTILPDCSFESAPACDILMVPGGPGVDEILNDAQWVEFTARQASKARYVFGVCTGTLLLGAAGLLKGKQATTHWSAKDLLPAFGASVGESRICIDGNLFTSGGVTSGIDMALKAVAELFDEDTARQIQLQIEYDPEPPFDGGTPATSARHIVDRCVQAGRQRYELRSRAVAAAAEKLS